MMVLQVGLMANRRCNSILACQSVGLWALFNDLEHQMVVKLQNGWTI